MMDRTFSRRRSPLTCHRSRLAVVVGLALAATIPTITRADFDEAETILESGTLGGTRGLRIRRIGADHPAFSKNPDFVYYPASSIKVLQHLYAMTLVEQGEWNLATTQGMVCTNGQNCSFFPNTESICQPQVEVAEDFLRKMMRNSSNTHTNTVQERVGLTFPLIYPLLQPATRGRVLITDFAQGTLGMADSGIFHKFGCGGFCGNDDANRLTLRDIERLYRAVAIDTDVISPAQRVVMKDLMLNEGDSFLDSIIDQEAAATGKNAWKAAFKAKLFMIYKAGSWTCSGKTYRSDSGLVQLPTHNGAHKRLYTWGAFTHDSESWAYLSGTVRSSVQELLRYPIRAALLTWGFGYAPADHAGGLVDTIDELLPSVGTGVGAPLRLARERLEEARSELEKEERGYDLAVEKLGEALLQIESARSVDPSVSRDLPLQILSIAREIAVDAVALLAMTGDGPELESAIAAMEQGIATGERESDLDFLSAMAGFQEATAAGAYLIDWQARGTGDEDEKVGFFGTPVSNVVFEDDFESGKLDW